MKINKKVKFLFPIIAACALFLPFSGSTPADASPTNPEDCRELTTIGNDCAVLLYTSGGLNSEDAKSLFNLNYIFEVTGVSSGTGGF